jgi:diguanylate cyclase (GGDEF)-like protein
VAVEQLSPTPWSTPCADEIVEAAGASDLFVFRRIAQRRFAHVGGAGRGAGWAGIVEVEAEAEPFVKRAFATRSVLRRSEGEAWHVFGPYYGRSVAVVVLSADVFVVFGADDERLDAVPDEDLEALARFASEALVEITPAKRLADELEALNAVRELLHTQTEDFRGALQHLVDTATTALSCDLGLVYVRDDARVAIADRRGGPPLLEREVLAPLAGIAARDVFPVCMQQAEADDLPAPFSAADGVVAYYLLELERPVQGILLLLHTRAAAPRGFTLLCQMLGARLVETAEPLLAAALLRDQMNAELERASSEARRDPLTGVGNRLAWTEALERASGLEDSTTSVVLLDCRGLKLINEEHGHHVGDEVLCRVARDLLASVRTGDLVARLGGDEFALLLYGADEEVTRLIVERIEAALASAHEAGELEVSLAIGTSTSRNGDVQSAQRAADAELIQSKRRFRETSPEGSNASNRRT